MPATEPVLADAAPEADQIADEIVVGPAGVTADDVLAVARRGARVRLAPDGTGRDGRLAPCRRGPRRGADARLRHLHRLRGARHPAYQPGPAREAAAQPHPLARRRPGPAGRARGRPGADVPAAEDARVRPDRRPAGGGADAGGRAERGHHPGGARARVAGLQRGPRPARALRARADRRGRGGRPHGERVPGGVALDARRDHARSAWRRRRASRSSTAPTACSAC